MKANTQYKPVKIRDTKQKNLIIDFMHVTDYIYF